MPTLRLQSTRRCWWNQHQSTSNASPELEETRTLCGGCDVSCLGDERQGRAGWNTWPEFSWTSWVLRWCKTAQQFYWSAPRTVALELHMDDFHGAATPSGRKQFIIDFFQERLTSKVVTDVSWENRKNISRDLQTPMRDETRIQPNNKYPESAADQLGLMMGAKTRPTPGVLTHRATMGATPLLTSEDTRLYRSCVGALVYYVLDRADAQLEVSILGSYSRSPTTGAMEALRRVTRCLLGNTRCARQTANLEC